MENGKIANLEALMSKDIATRVAEAEKQMIASSERYTAYATDPAKFGEERGYMHPASLQAWNRIAELAGVPTIKTELVATISVEDAYKVMEDRPISKDAEIEVRKAVAYANAGGYWRSDLCAGGDVKYAMSKNEPMPDVLHIAFDDMRMMDMHYGMPDIKILGRERVTPVRHNGWPVEFRVFNGGKAADNSASWYYPQGKAEPDETLQAAMNQAIAYARAMHDKRDELGIIPWFPNQNTMPEDCDGSIGSTIDFMLTEEYGLVMIDAGPGFGYGAHPCCFIDCKVEGQKWTLSENVEPR